MLLPVYLCHPHSTPPLLPSGQGSNLNCKRANIRFIPHDHLRYLHGGGYIVVVGPSVVITTSSDCPRLMIFACASVSCKMPSPKPSIVMAPTSSLKTRLGEWISSVSLAARTAARAAFRIAVITRDRPAVMPAARPIIERLPILRIELAFKFALNAPVTLLAVVLA